MSPNEIPMSLTSPQDSPDIYMLAVLSLYVELPDTPSRARLARVVSAKAIFLST